MQVKKKMTQEQFRSVLETAKERYIHEVLGERPDFKSVAKTTYNPNALDALQKWAILLLVVLAIFTSYKVGIAALPFSESLMRSLGNNAVLHPLIITTGQITTVLLMILIGTPGLIYFKLLSQSPAIQKKLKETRHYKWWQRASISYLSPRIPAVATYVIVVWLLLVSNHGDGADGTTVYFERFLPVLLEVGLANFVGDKIRDIRSFRDSVNAELQRRLTPYENKLANYRTDSDYLRMVYQEMSEYLPRMRVRGKREMPNIHLLKDEKALLRAVLSEYRRLTSGDAFADSILNKEQESPETVVVEDATSELRKPPGDDTQWDAETLKQDFALRGFTPDTEYTEKQLNRDYAAGYKARSAFRAGAKQFFKKYQ